MMSARPFAPVWITLPGRDPRRVENVFEALECLTNAWPRRGKVWRRAVGTCRDALDGVTPPNAARRTLLAAVQDAMGHAESNTVLRSSAPVDTGVRHGIDPIVVNRSAEKAFARRDVCDWNQSFGPAVILRLAPTGKVRFAIHSTREMAAFLLDQWPGTTTPKHAEACRTCRDAIEGRVPAASARTALIEATKEAGFVIENGISLPVVPHAAAPTTADRVKPSIDQPILPAMP